MSLNVTQKQIKEPRECLARPEKIKGARIPAIISWTRGYEEARM